MGNNKNSVKVKLKKLQKSIEEKRYKLDMLIECNEGLLETEEILEISKQLDHILTEYMKLKNQNKGNV